MEVGETVVLVGDVDGMPAGKEGRVMRVRGDMLLIGCRLAHRLEFVLALSTIGRGRKYTGPLFDCSVRFPKKVE